MSKDTKADTKPSPDQSVKKAVEGTPGGTTEGIGQVAGVARSTAGKVLGRLADAGEVVRHQGGRDGGKRLPDRWTLAGVAMPPAFAGQVVGGATAAADAKPHAKPGKGDGGASRRGRQPAKAGAAEPASGPNDEPVAAKPDRLKAGGLEPIVLAYLEQHADNGPHGPAAVAKAINRSSGAVANCLKRLAASKQAQQVSDKPRRYCLAA
jgi:hypothetical protein